MHNEVKVTNLVNGQVYTFASQNEAARKIGIGSGTIYHALKRDGVVLGEFKFELTGKRTEPSRKIRAEHIVTGEVLIFESVRAAAGALKVPLNKIWSCCSDNLDKPYYKSYRFTYLEDGQ